MSAYLLVALAGFVVVLIVLRTRRGRRTPTSAVPTVGPRTKTPTDDELRSRLMARLAFDMRAPIATATRAMTAMHDKKSLSQPVLPPSPVPLPKEGDGYEISWAP
ncbi:hypothetical protein [Mycobacteroides sp. LB1]|uniref:hypothetical protein n=1 Tax=Mycobacteroides sp. LB1 TaxID=2750814 RepID=UPI0015DDF642|nr:hypothetical protein [Mycobacteroides sp. LB1]